MLMLNKAERQVIKLQLDREQKALEDLERQYKRALKDIDDKIRLLQNDELTQSRIYQIQYQKALKGQVEGILDKLHGDEYATIQQCLHDSYQTGFIGTMYSIHGQGIPLIVPLDQQAAVQAIITDSKLSDDLYKELGVNVKQLKQAITQEVTRGIASNMPFADIARNIANRSKAPLARAKTIVRTEGHRIQQASANDARNAAKERGCDVVKQWDGTLDGDTRSTHRRLDGQIRETDEPFEMDGKKAMYPGDFGKAEEDCNCRCVALTRAKWALDEDELKTLKERAKFFELDKKKDFEDFTAKYLTATGKDNAGSGEKTMWEAEQEQKWQKARRVYGKVDGQQYTASQSDTVSLEASKFAMVDGEYVKTFSRTGEFTVQPNDDAQSLVVTCLPRSHSDTRNVILTNGRVAMNYYSATENTRYKLQAMVSNEIDVLGGVREDGVFYRVTGNAKEVGYLRTGKIRPSKNHMTGEVEEGLSVWETVKYSDKYLHKVSGKVVDIGSDGEPVLDVKSVELVQADVDDIIEKRQLGRERFKAKYGWTDAQIDQALNGGYKIIR